MTQQYQPEFTPPPKKRPFVPILIIVITSLLMGVMVGLSVPKTGSESIAVAALPGPTVTATATVQAEGGTPQSCLAALDEADKIIQISADTMEIVGRTFDHLADMDLDAVNDDADDIGAQTDKLNSVSYPEYAAACRAEG